MGDRIMRIAREPCCRGETRRSAAPCRTGGPYDAWLAAFEREAAAQGISQRAIAAAAPYLTYDQRIVNIDRGQRVFTQTFLEFSDRMAAAYRIQRGAALIKTYAAGVCAHRKAIRRARRRSSSRSGGWKAISAPIWANIIRSARSPRSPTIAGAPIAFAPSCFDALRLIERGDLPPDEMIGSWAGELGQTQMMPSEYYQYAVDYDGDGKRNLLAQRARRARLDGELSGRARLEARRAVADRSARAGEACRGIRPISPSSCRARNGRRSASRSPTAGRCRRTILPASLLLPMGRFGPAFLVYPNFQVYLQWNNSLVYSTTAAYLATRIAGAPPLHRGNPPPALPFNDVKEMQGMLVRAGYDVGTIDGFLGLKTRQAVKAMQMKYGLPADSYPTAELLARMRAGRS